MTKTVGSIVTTYDYDANNRLIKSKNNGITTTYNYDNNGNQLNQSTNGKTTNYTYDGYNRLIEVQNPDSTWQMNIYDAEGLRASTVENGARTDYVFDRGSVISETAANTNSTTRYIRGMGLVAQDNSGTLGYYLHNAHGDVVNVVDGSGKVLNTYNYDPFGAVTSSTGDTANRFMYAGEQYDNVAGQYYLRTRHYNPGTGRFTAEDIYNGTAGNPLSLNRYTYCENNPVMYTDPLGLWAYLMREGGTEVYKKDTYDDTLQSLAELVLKDSSKWRLFGRSNNLDIGETVGVTSKMMQDAGLCPQGKVSATKGNGKETVFEWMGDGKTIYAGVTSDAGAGIGLLTETQKQANARYIYNYLTARGWSLNAICGLLGNMEKESGINPSEWQTLDVTTGWESGYGLVQWTPSGDKDKFLGWANLTAKQANTMAQNNPKQLMDIQLEFMIYTLDSKSKFYTWGDYKKRGPRQMTVNEYINSGLDVGLLAKVWEASYERPLYLQSSRAKAAEKWFDFLN